MITREGFDTALVRVNANNNDVPAPSKAPGAAERPGRVEVEGEGFEPTFGIFQGWLDQPL